MGSRKEEERNEKIIRGLMKLPPNRRCINCNSLGPQYVCTNFWTFVCMTCSGIHREFTHRVKSVSMAKFTSQEVEALQNGGNQRAREIYLKDWDFQRQRLPDNSNVDKVREFIKNVYVDRRYAGGKTSEKPPKDTQGLGSREDMTRRASSYHSYSQSPPYDYQYEDRRYGKHGAVLTRKPGSDRGHLRWEGDPFRSGTQSPSFEKDVGFNSPPIQPSRDIIQPSRDIGSSVANFKRDVDGIPRPQRTTSLGRMGSFDSNSASLKSYNSGGLADAVSEPEQAAGAHQDKMSTFPQSQSPLNYGGLDLFQEPVAPGPVSSAAPPINLFQPPATSSAPVNMVHTSQASSASSINSYRPALNSSPSSMNFFEITEQPFTATLDRNPQELSSPKNEGWATFDTPPATAIPRTESLAPTTSIPETENLCPAPVPSNGGSSVKFDPFPPYLTGMQWPAFQNSSAHGPAPSCDPWFDNLHNLETPAIATSTQSWSAFDDSTTTHLPLEGFEQNSEPQLPAYKPSSTADQYLSSIISQDSSNDGNLGATSHHGPPGLNVPSHVDMGPSYTSSVLPLVGDVQAPTTENKSSNPFDFPCDSDFEHGNMFLDMSSLQAALPEAELSSTFLGGATQSWFPQNTVTPFIPAAAQGGLAYMSGQSPTPNVSTQEPVASVGGNPFA
ncbi:Arf GTPase activating protein [Melia azedarach]|uniref:Arf GTPase activating protein n=1 Tax=Melia azedarach TaxID=155640 RepID=A0ACC1YD35_MELAZ|nr:Arf GTPase activating protein [Melia azedarach]